MTELSVKDRAASLSWPELHNSLHERGYALTPQLLSEGECDNLRALYDEEGKFRSCVVMARHNFGLGEYKYFSYPLPEIVQSLRAAMYPNLVPVANAWNEVLGNETRFPTEHEELLRRCHRAGQQRPTPLMLRYETGGYNCLHQDLYGPVYFPMQMAIMLGQRGRDWQGGEFALVEQRPRAQSKVEVLQPDLGHAVIFSTRYRPVRGTRGYYRVNLKHGVSRVSGGLRMTLGIIFHDAE